MVIFGVTASESITKLFIARKEFAEKYPRVVFQVVNELNRAAELCRNDSTQAAAAAAGALGISSNQALKEMELLSAGK